MPDEVVPGACLCGAIRFSVRLPTLFCGHCHCSICRRNHGAGFVTWFAVPRSQFSLDAGEGELQRFRSSDHGTRSFCRRCGSSLFCESTEHADQIDIVLANMAGPIDRPPQVHVYFDDRAPWVMAEDGLPRLGGATGQEPIKPDA
ncbi:MAG: GFA family protein [Myxococcota bacterium]